MPNSNIQLKNSWLSLLSLLLLAFLILAYWPPIHISQKNPTYTDFGKFYQSSVFEQQNQPIYQKGTLLQFNKKAQQLQPETLSSNLNPPFFQLLFYPLGFLSYSISFYVWTLFSALCGLSSILLVLNILKQPINIKTVLYSSLALLAYFPFYANVFLGQVAMPLLLFLCGAWKLLDNKQLILAAIILGVTASLKLFLLIFAIFFAIRRYWIELGVFILTVGMCFFVTLPFYGLPTYNDYLYNINHIVWYASNWNASFLGFFTRALGSIHEKNIPTFYLPHLTNFLFNLFSFITLTVMVFFSHKYREPEQKIQLYLDFAIFIIAGLLISPLGWIYYFPLLIIPFSILIYLVSQQKLSFTFYIYICIAILLSSIPHVIIASHNVVSASLIWLWSGSYFYALIIALILCMLAKTKITLKSAITPIQPNTLALILSCSLLPSLLGIIFFSSNLLTHENDFTPKIIQLHWQKIPSLN